MKRRLPPLSVILVAVAALTVVGVNVAAATYAMHHSETGRCDVDGVDPCQR